MCPESFLSLLLYSLHASKREKELMKKEMERMDWVELQRAVDEKNNSNTRIDGLGLGNRKD